MHEIDYELVGTVYGVRARTYAYQYELVHYYLTYEAYSSSIFCLRNAMTT